MTKIESLLLRDEGFRSAAYTDSEGYLTIGIGTLIDARRGGGITLEEALFLLRGRLDKIESSLRAQFPWFSALSETRQCVMLSMAYQLGLTGLLSFRNTLRAVAEGRYGDAADGMRASKWARQTPLRVSRLAAAMESDDFASFRLDEDAS